MLQAYGSVSEHDSYVGGNSGLGVVLCSVTFHWGTVPLLCRNMHTLFRLGRLFSLARVCLLYHHNANNFFLLQQYRTW
jgi:hypothetical protein